MDWSSDAQMVGSRLGGSESGMSALGFRVVIWVESVAGRGSLGTLFEVQTRAWSTYRYGALRGAICLRL